MRRTLYGLVVSPWTERARWALEHHRLDYHYHEHVPMLGEVLLRMKARAAKATVPLLEDGDRVVMGSVEIARHGDRVGSGSVLFPPEHDREISRWVDAAERMTNAGRAWLLRNITRDREALAETLPSFVPDGLRGTLAPSAAMAVRFLSRKHSVPANAERLVEETVRPVLVELREALERRRDVSGGPTYLLGPAGFTGADLVVAASLHVIEPHARATVGPRTRAAWTQPELAREFADVLAWRDAIYDEHR